MKVAAKIVSQGSKDWVQEEIENEARKLEVLRPLQGSVLPEKLFSGKVNGGKDWLLITRFVEGDRLNSVVVTEKVANNARAALKEIHKRGHIHGDVMPRNILVNGRGECVFIDLGQAKRVKTETDKEAEMRELEVWLKTA